MNAKKVKKARQLIRKEILKSDVMEQAIKDQIEFLVNQNNQLVAHISFQNKLINELQKELANVTDRFNNKN